MSQTINPRLVGLFGYANTGKDSIVPAFATIDGQRCICFLKPTSAPILRDIQSLLGQDHDLRDRKVKDKFRDMLVHYADDWRAIDPDHWINIFKADVQFSYQSHCTAVKPEDVLVFTGLRDPREAKWIHDAGGLLIRIIRIGSGPANPAEFYSICAIEQLPHASVINDDMDLAKPFIANLISAHFSIDVDEVGPASPLASLRDQIRKLEAAQED
jgi:hypothetical protein